MIDLRYWEINNQTIVIETEWDKVFLELDGSWLINDDRIEINPDWSDYNEKITKLMSEYIKNNPNIDDLPNEENSNDIPDLF